MTRTGDNFGLAGRVAVVSGAGGGIGRAVVERLLGHGCTVVAADLDVEPVQHWIVQQGWSTQSVLAQSVDVADMAACTALAERTRSRLGDTAVLVNCAGIAVPAQLESDDFAALYSRTMDINVGGTLNLTRAYVAQLKATRGSVVNLGSIASFIAGNSSIPYGTSKGAIRSLTMFLARDLGAHGVRVNAVAPGVTNTSMTARVRNDPIKLGAVVDRTVLGRIATAEEIAAPIAFLASPLASYITGTMLPVDGGFLSR